jgi:hypothetical protein
MNAAEQRARCPVKIGQTYKGGKVIYILGDKNGCEKNGIELTTRIDN